MRYIIKNGKFGDYFYDKRLKADLGLKEVLSLLNTPTEIRTELDEITTRLSHHADMIYNKLVRKEGIYDDGERCSIEKGGWCPLLKIDCINYNEPCDHFKEKEVISK